MSARLLIGVPPEGEEVLMEGIIARWHRGRLRVEMQSDLAVPPGPPSLAFYERILPLVYGETIQLLKNPVARFTVDRAKQALYWEAESGQRLYIFPFKNQTGKIQSFETWIE